MMGVVPFVHPAIALLALGAGLIPVLVHLINRRRYTRVRWAAMSFLLSASRRSARRVRLQQWLLLVVRVAVVVLWGFAIARPYVPSSLPFAPGSSRAHHILLIDNSLSMQARDVTQREPSADPTPRGSKPSARFGPDQTRFAIAKTCAERLIASFDKSDAVSIVTLAEPAQALIAHPVYDRRVLRERVAALAPTQRVADTTGALMTAFEMLKASPSAPGNRAVYLISDLPARVWQGPAPDVPTPAVRAARRLADAMEDAKTRFSVLPVVGAAAEASQNEISKPDSAGENLPKNAGARIPSRTDNRESQPTWTGSVPNLAVTRLQPESLLVGVNLPVRLVAEVTNFGPVSVRNASLEFRLWDRVSNRSTQIVRREQLAALEPGASTVATILMEFTAPGTKVIEARLSGPGKRSLEPTRADALALDDARFCSIEVPQTTRVLLVDGRPLMRESLFSSTRVEGRPSLASQAGFVATALAPDAERQDSVTIGVDRGRSGAAWGNRTKADLPSGARTPSSAGAETAGARIPSRTPITHAALIDPKIISHPELAGEALTDYSAVVLCNVERLAAERWVDLQRFVANGGGLLVFGGDLVDVEHYNRFGHAGGSGLLPGRFGRAVSAGEAARNGAAGEGYAGFLLPTRPRTVDRTGGPRRPAGAPLPHPIVAEFADLPGSGLFLARVQKYLAFEPDADRARIVLTYTNDEPAIVASSFGRGRVVVCTTSANMEWTNLPAKGDYVSLLVNTVAFLSPRRGDHRNLVVGETAVEPMTAVQSALPGRIETSEGAIIEPSVIVRARAPTPGAMPELALAYGPVERAGVFTLSIGLEDLHFAVNVDPCESDLRAVRAQDFPGLLDRPVHLITELAALSEGPGPARLSELALIALYLVGGLLLAEMWMAMWFGAHHRRGKTWNRSGSMKPGEWRMDHSRAVG